LSKLCGALFAAKRIKERTNMLIEQLISPEVPTLLPTDTGSKALGLMEELHLTQLPMVQDEQYLGLIQETDLLDWDTPERALESGSGFMNYRPAVSVSGHTFDVLRMISEQNLNIVPVVDQNSKYMGAITRDDLLKFIADNSGADEPGGIIVLQLEPRQYSLSEIARIAESEDVTIITSALSTNRETGALEVMLKTNRTNLEALVSSFQRHEYVVKEVFGAETGQEEIMDRYRSLMNYINM
jgi:CBS domain-containing protein